MDATQERTNLDCQLAEFGESLTVYTGPDDAVGRSCTGIIHYNDARVVREPRTNEPAVTVKLVNSATEGICGAEWTEDFEVLVPPRPGATPVRKRTTRMLAAGRFGTWITWELG